MDGDGVPVPRHEMRTGRSQRPVMSCHRRGSGGHGSPAEATLMFTDLVDSTATVVLAGDQAWARLLRRHHAVVRAELLRYGGTEVDTTGDGFFATFPAPMDAVMCATDVRDRLRDLNLTVRASVHTGRFLLVDGKPAGLAVHVAARALSKAGAGEVIMTDAARLAIDDDGITWHARGRIADLPHPTDLFAVARRGMSAAQQEMS